MFKLALALGKTVAELERTLTVQELTEWQAYDRLDPFGGYRYDLQTAHILQAKYGDEDSKLSDFLPVDPYPMNEEQQEQFAIYQAEKEAQKEVQDLIAMLKRVEDKD